MDLIWVDLAWDNFTWVNELNKKSFRTISGKLKKSHFTPLNWDSSRSLPWDYVGVGNRESCGGEWIGGRGCGERVSAVTALGAWAEPARTTDVSAGQRQPSPCQELGFRSWAKPWTEASLGTDREEIRGQVNSELRAAPAMPTSHRTLPTRCARVRKEPRPMALSPQGFPLGSACSRVHEDVCHPGFHLWLWFWKFLSLLEAMQSLGKSESFWHQTGLSEWLRRTCCGRQL